MKRRAPLKRGRPPRKVSLKRRTRTGKEGITRLSKQDMDTTRTQIYFAAEGMCQMRKRLIAEVRQSDLSPEHKLVAISNITVNCWRWVSLARGHDAHIRAKRNNGDELSNRIWSCPPCHLVGDHNAFGKPVPPKPKL